MALPLVSSRVLLHRVPIVLGSYKCNNGWREHWHNAWLRLGCCYPTPPHQHSPQKKTASQRWHGSFCRGAEDPFLAAGRGALAACTGRPVGHRGDPNSNEKRPWKHMERIMTKPSGLGGRKETQTLDRVLYGALPTQGLEAALISRRHSRSPTANTKISRTRSKLMPTCRHVCWAATPQAAPEMGSFFIQTLPQGLRLAGEHHGSIAFYVRTKYSEEPDKARAAH